MFPTRYGCNCGYEGRLHRHGFYSRNAITRYSTHRIFILRIKCPSCFGTYSLLPSFLIPYRQYTFDVIFLCLHQLYVTKNSYQKILKTFREFNSYTPLKLGNIYSFKKRMKEVSPVVNSFFATYDEFYWEMSNPTAETITKKIHLFLEQGKDFNLTYFEKTERCFFAKT